MDIQESVDQLKEWMEQSYNSPILSSRANSICNKSPIALAEAIHEMRNANPTALMAILDYQCLDTLKAEQLIDLFESNNGELFAQAIYQQVFLNCTGSLIDLVFSKEQYQTRIEKLEALIKTGRFTNSLSAIQDSAYLSIMTDKYVIGTLPQFNRDSNIVQKIPFENLALTAPLLDFDFHKIIHERIRMPNQSLFCGLLLVDHVLKNRVTQNDTIIANNNFLSEIGIISLPIQNERQTIKLRKILSNYSGHTFKFNFDEQAKQDLERIYSDAISNLPISSQISMSYNTPVNTVETIFPMMLANDVVTKPTQNKAYAFVKDVLYRWIDVLGNDPRWEYLLLSESVYSNSEESHAKRKPKLKV